MVGGCLKVSIFKVLLALRLLSTISFLLLLMGHWNCLHLDVSPAIADSICAICHEAGSCGISINDHANKTHLEVYFPSQIDLDAIQLRLNEVYKKDLGSSQKFIWTRIDAEDWTQGWREFFRPIWVTPNIVVHPPWIPITEENVFSIVIEPKMAFGTGGHESTQLCLQMLDERVVHGMHCLDLGTGSGILAVAAAMRGAKKILALDTDKQAVKNVAENTTLNGVDRSRVMICLGSIDSAVGRTYDLIFANIQSSILRPMIPRLTELISSTGSIIFSGLLETERVEFCQDIRMHGLIPEEVLSKNEWISVSVGRGG
ncbi:MAG: 50S ribosomal protein L11 methyltransferase [Candidatus Latescibacterota bacterium]|nr:50S ribosomal protein L11 methyltransferase [Candidatus Latescibacterota bacterium]